MGLVQITQIQEPMQITVFHLKDNLNMGNYKELFREAEDAYAAGARYLVLDLAETKFLSSAGISGIINILKLFNQVPVSKGEQDRVDQSTLGARSNRHLRLCNCSPSIINVLRIAGLFEAFGVFDNLQDAVTSFEG